MSAGIYLAPPLLKDEHPKIWSTPPTAVSVTVIACYKWVLSILTDGYTLALLRS